MKCFFGKAQVQSVVRSEDEVFALVQDVLQNMTGNSTLPNQARPSFPLMNASLNRVPPQKNGSKKEVSLIMRFPVKILHQR